MPKCFQDKSGKTWHLLADLPAQERVKDATGIYLPDIVDPAKAQSGKSIDGVDLLRVLVVLCNPDDIEKFKAAMNDPDVIENAANALVDAVIDFLPRRQKSFMRSIALTQREMAPKILERATREADSMRARLNKASGMTGEPDSSGTTAESPELTPATDTASAT